MFGRVVAGLKALFSLPSEQRWPAFKRAVKMGVTASAGSFLAFGEHLREVQWSDFSVHRWHQFVTDNSLDSLSRAVGIAVLVAVLTALAEVTSQQPRDRRKERKAEAQADREAILADLYEQEDSAG